MFFALCYSRKNAKGKKIKKEKLKAGLWAESHVKSHTTCNSPDNLDMKVPQLNRAGYFAQFYSAITRQASRFKLLWNQDWEPTDPLTQLYKWRLCKCFSRKGGFRESVQLKNSLWLKSVIPCTLIGGFVLPYTITLLEKSVLQLSKHEQIISDFCAHSFYL